MNVWRITIKTDAVEGVDPRRFCLERNILGVGWPVDGPQSLDWDTYHALGTAKYYDDGDKGRWPGAAMLKEGSFGESPRVRPHRRPTGAPNNNTANRESPPCM